MRSAMVCVLGSLVACLAACAPSPRRAVSDAQGGGPSGTAGDPAAARAPSTTAAPPGDHAFRKVHYLADSIPIVGASDVAHRAVTLIKASYPGEFFDQAVGGRALHFYANDAARRSAVVDAIRTRPTQPPTEVWIALLYNDWAGAKWTAAEYGAALADFAKQLEAALPGVLVICQSPHVDGATTNARGESLDQFIAEMQRVCAAPRRYLNGGEAGIVRPDDFTDSVHLRDSGHAKWAAFTIAGAGWSR